MSLNRLSVLTFFEILLSSESLLCVYVGRLSEILYGRRGY